MDMSNRFNVAVATRVKQIFQEPKEYAMYSKRCTLSIVQIIQWNFSGSSPDSSFTTAASNSFLSPLENIS